MIRRNGVGASTSLAPVVHPEDAQPNEVSKKRKGQGLPPIVASSKPPVRTSFNRRGGGRGTIRGGYRGGPETDVGTSTQYAMRGGRSSWRGHRNPSGNWPRRADNASPSPHDPSSNRRPAHPIPPTPPTAIQGGVDKGKGPIRGGEQRWHRRNDAMTHRNPEQDRRRSPWGQQPDSGYAQRAVPRPTEPPKVDGLSPAPLPHPRHPSLPAKPPPQSSPQHTSQSPSHLLQPGPQDSGALTTSEWYLRAGSPDPKLPPGSLGRKNPEPQPTISMPLPGRLRKLQDRQDARGAVESVPVIPPQPEIVASLPVASPVHEKPQSKAELSQVPILPGIPKDQLPKLRAVETAKPADDPQAEKFSFVPPEYASNVYKSMPLSEQRKSHSQPRDVPLRLPLPAESSAYRSKAPSHQHKSLPKPQCDVKPTPARISPPSSSKPQPQPPRQSKAEISVPTNHPETEALSFLPPQSASGAYVPVPLSLQRQSRMSLYAMSPTPDLQADESRFIPPQELPAAHVPAPLSQQRKPQPDSYNFSEPQPKAAVDLKDSSHSSSRTVAHPTHVKDQGQVPELNPRHHTEAKRDDGLKPVDRVLSGKFAITRVTPSSTPPSIYDLVTPPPPQSKPPSPGPPVTPRKTQTSQASNTMTTNEMRINVPGPEIVVKEEHLSPLSRSPIKPMRKLVTEAASFYPMPSSCDKAVPAYKENRKIFFKENSKKLSALGLKRTKAFFRDDGLVIEWKSGVPVWSDTLKPEENNLATAMEEFLRQSAERSGNKRKRKEQGVQNRDGPELSPGAKRVKISKQTDPLPLSERKRKTTDPEDMLSPEKRRKTSVAGSSPMSGRPTPSSSRKSDHLIATNGALGLSFGDVASSKDEPIYIASSPESSPKASSKPLPTATAKKVPLPTRLHATEKSNSAPSFPPSTSSSNSMSNSLGLMSIGAAEFGSERVKLPALTSVDAIETVPHTASKTGVRTFASGPPPSSKRMIFKPTNPSRTSRVTPTVHASAPTPPAEDCGIGQHRVVAVHTTDRNSVTAPAHSNPDGRSPSRAFSPIAAKDELPVQKEVDDHSLGIQMASIDLDKQPFMDTTASHLGDREDREQRDNNSDMYCSEHEDAREDDEDEDDESKLAVDFFTRFITFFDSDRSKLVSAYAKNALFTCRVHDLRPRRTSVAEHFAPESKLLFHSSHSNASASTVEHGRRRICDRLRIMGPHKFRGSVVWDLAPLPLDSPGHLMFSVHGEVVDPTHTGQHLDHILTVDQTFVLRPRTDDDNVHDENSLSDSLHDGQEWPLVAISHQMTVRESRLLPPDAITNLLPWVVDIGL